MYKLLLMRGLRLCLVLACIIFVYLALMTMYNYIYPFLVAFIISFLINPIVTLLEKKIGFPRPIATITVILLFFLGGMGIVFFIIMEIVQGASYLAEKTPAYFSQFMQAMETFWHATLFPIYQKTMSFFHSLSPEQQMAINENIDQFINYIATAGTDLLQHFFKLIPGFIVFLPSSLTIGIFIVLATFFITNDWYQWQKKLDHWIPNRITVFGGEFVIHTKTAFIGYLKGQLILVSITSLLILTGLIIFRIEHGLTIAFIAAIADLLPLIGTGMIFIPWILFLFVTGNYALTVKICILYIIIIIVRQVLEPKVISSSVGINPLVGLIALFVCIQLWGALGIILTPILLVMIHVIQRTKMFVKLWNFIKTG